MLRAMKERLSWWEVVASVCGLGFSPIAPGTVASAFGMALYLIFKPSWQWVFASVVVLGIVGTVGMGLLSSGYLQVG